MRFGRFVANIQTTSLLIQEQAASAKISMPINVLVSQSGIMCDSLHAMPKSLPHIEVVGTVSGDYAILLLP